MNGHKILRILIITTGILINLNQTAVTMYGLTDEELEGLDTQEALEEKKTKDKEISQGLLLKTLEQADAKYNEICEIFKKLHVTRDEHSKQIIKMDKSLKNLLCFYYLAPGFKSVKKKINDLLINDFLSLMATNLSQPCINRFGTIFSEKCLIKFLKTQTLYAERTKKGFKLPHTQKCINQTRRALLSIHQILAYATSSFESTRNTIKKVLSKIEHLLNCSPFKITDDIMTWHKN